jgi:hypothetical protein
VQFGIEQHDAPLEIHGPLDQIAEALSRKLPNLVQRHGIRLGDFPHRLNALYQRGEAHFFNAASRL